MAGDRPRAKQIIRKIRISEAMLGAYEALQLTRSSRALLIVATGVLLLAPRLGYAVAIQPVIVEDVPSLNLDPGGLVGPQIPVVPCEPRVGAIGLPSLFGIPVVSLTVTISGKNIKLVNEDAWCDSYIQPLSEGEWTWELTDRPWDSTTALMNPEGLTPTLKPDVAGDYEVTLHTCPSGCPFEGTSIVVPPTDRVLRFHTDDRLPPERHPARPPSVSVIPTCDGNTNTCTESSLPCQDSLECSAAHQPLFDADLTDDKCNGGGGVWDPQWVTVQNFYGPQQYAGYHDGIVYAVEGAVEVSRISDADYDANHESQDANWNVDLDPLYRQFHAPTGHSAMHNEWETNSLAPSFQPSHGDRVSMWGYLIHDCGHDPYKSEIHPPVGMAVHRERAVPLPEEWGTGVFVPGIVTDVWFNRDAGGMIGGRHTSLHQPAGFDFCGTFDCRGDPIDFPADLNAVFSFRVHLPWSPKAVLENAGVDVSGLPEIPLYKKVFPGNVGEDRIHVEVIKEDAGSAPEVTYLQVTVDLRGLSGERPWFRMAAAWVYPDSANWGLRRWRLILRKLDVTDDAEDFRGGADWRLWAQVNNSQIGSAFANDGLPRHEWSKIVNSNSVRKRRDIDFGGRPWATGSADGDRYLGPDALLYPGQGLELHMSGYEADWVGGDNLGLINRIHFSAGEFQQNNECRSTFLEGLSPAKPGCGYYTAFYEVEDLGPVGNAALSLESLDLIRAYRLVADECGDDVGCIPGLVLGDGQLIAARPPPFPHPEEAPLEIGSGAFSREATALFESGEAEEEENILNNISVAGLQIQLEDLIQNDPEGAEAFLTYLRQSYDEALVELGDEARLDLQIFEMVLPPHLYAEYFGDIPDLEPDPDGNQRSIKGAGDLGTGNQRTHVNVHLHCDPIRQPQALRVDWNSQNRFVLDALTMVACDVAPDPMETFAGRGLGSLNGRAGYVAEWTMVDHGPGKDVDALRIRIFAPDGSLVHDMGGTIEGNLTGRTTLAGCGNGFAASLALLPPLTWLGWRKRRSRG